MILVFIERLRVKVYRTWGMNKGSNYLAGQSIFMAPFRIHASPAQCSSLKKLLFCLSHCKLPCINPSSPHEQHSALKDQENVKPLQDYYGKRNTSLLPQRTLFIYPSLMKEKKKLKQDKTKNLKYLSASKTRFELLPCTK